MSTFTLRKEKINEAVEKSSMDFYTEMKLILASKRGKKFQFMMLDKSFERHIRRNSRAIAQLCDGNPLAPLQQAIDKLLPP